MLRARGLRRTWGGSPAVHDLDLEVGAGEVVGLLGPLLTDPTIDFVKGH